MDNKTYILGCTPCCQPESINRYIIHSIFYYSLSGLTRHQPSCTGQGNQIQDDHTHREMSFACPTCQKPFSQKRYLTQHLGSKRCVKRKEFLERTASFSIAPSGGSTTEDIPLEAVSVKSCCFNSLIPYLFVLWTPLMLKT